MFSGYHRPFEYAPPQEPDISVLYSDDDLLVLDKPTGLLSVAGKTPDLADCLEARAVRRFAGASIVHRLDMSTSGVLIMARNARAHRIISLQLQNRKTSKTYIALVWGRIESQTGSIDLPLRCDWPNRPRQMVDHLQGRAALTNWEVIAHEGNITRVKLFPHTGRSHQLRVHMTSLGYPILGDDFYAHDAAFHAAPRLCLHAQSHTILHPSSGEDISFNSPCPF